MKIEREEIKGTIKFLKEINYKPIAGEYKIVFPINPEATKEVDGLELELVNNKFGSEKMPEPALELKESKEGAVLTYCDFTYARKFDILTYCDLTNNKLSKNATKLFSNLECFLVNKNNILVSFEL